MRSVSARTPAGVPRWTRPASVPAPAVEPATAASALPRTAEDERLNFPFVVFCIFTFILIGRPQDYFGFLVPLRPASLFMVLVIAVTAFQRRETGSSPFGLRDVRLYLALFAVMLIGVPFSLYPRMSLDYIINIYVQNVVFYIMVLYHVTTVARFRQFAVLLVLTAAFFTTMSLQYGIFGGGRYSSTVSNMFDPNDMSAVAVSLLAFPVAVLLGAFRPLVKSIALATVVFGVLLALYTGSRGGFIGLTTFLVVFLCFRIPGVSAARKVILVLFLLAGALINIDKINVERYQTIFSLEDDYNSTDEQGRKALWIRGLKIFAAYPLTGAGVFRFQEAVGVMRLDEGNVPPRWQAAHNSYIEILAETGIAGGVLFVLLIIRSLRTLNRLGHAPAGTPFASPEMAPLRSVARVFFAGLVAHAVTTFFLSWAYSVNFALWFAVAVSLTRIAMAASPPVAVAQESLQTAGTARARVRR
jgi:O-antigen ligase